MQKVNVSKEITKKRYSTLKNLLISVFSQQNRSNCDVFSLFSTVASATFKEKSFLIEFPNTSPFSIEQCVNSLPSDTTFQNKIL